MKGNLRYLQYFGSILLLFGIFIIGCRRSTTSKPAPNPLAGYYVSVLHDISSIKPIKDDYEGYIKAIPLKPSDFIGGVQYFENTSGEHAVEISVGVSGTWWEHVLFYDKDNKRIKVIKFQNGGYRS